MTVIDTLRDATYDELMEVLKAQHAAKFDVVVPSSQIRYEKGQLVIAGHGAEPELTEDGVTAADLTLAPTEWFHRQMATRTGIGWNYYNRLADDTGKHVDLLDTNVNYWLNELDRNVMVRAFRTGNGGQARGLVSDGYGLMDNLTFLLGVMKAVKATGQPYHLSGLNLSDTHLRVDIVSPAVTAIIPESMRDYVSPFSGLKATELPLVHSMVRFSNSEVGNGKMKIEPGAKWEICANGATLTRFAKEFSFTRTHRGSRLAEGIVKVSDETRAAQVDLMVAEATDHVRSFFDPEWFQGTMAKIDAQAQKPIERSDATEIIAKVSDKLGFSETEADLIAADFFAGQQMTNGGVFNAITAAAQRVGDPERARKMEDRALDALALV